MALDINKLITDIKDVATGILNKDVSSLRGFSESQLEALAQQAVFVEAGIISGQITPATRDFFLDNLEELALNFLKIIRGLVQVTIEKIWNAIVKVIFTAIEASTGLALL